MPKERSTETMKSMTERTDGGGFLILQDGIVVVSGSGPYEDILREANHYAVIYGQDGPLKVGVWRRALDAELSDEEIGAIEGALRAAP